VTGLRLRRAGVQIEVRVSTRADGDFHLEVDPADLHTRRQAFVALPWSQPDEVHGAHVRRVERAGEHDRAVADGLVTDVDDAVLGIWVGDCAPVALVGAAGAIGAVHAGWRGIEGGVLGRGVEALRAIDDGPVEAVLGPCIHPCCYAFGDVDLERLAAAFGSDVVGATSDGRRALDVPAAVRSALAVVGVDVVTSIGGCTGCEADRWWSHRARGERSRQVMAVWRRAA